VALAIRRPERCSAIAARTHKRRFFSVSMHSNWQVRVEDSPSFLSISPAPAALPIYTCILRHGPRDGHGHYDRVHSTFGRAAATNGFGIIIGFVVLCSLYGWWFGLAVTRWSRSTSYSTPGPVNTGMHG